MNYNSKSATASNMTATIASIKVADSVPQIKIPTRSETTISLGDDSSAVDRIRADTKASDDRKSSGNAHCERDQNNFALVSRPELIQGFSESSTALNISQRNCSRNLFGHCVDGTSCDHNDDYNGPCDYDLIAAAIIEENDRLNQEVDELLMGWDSPPLRDDDFTELITLFAHYQ